MSHPRIRTARAMRRGDRRGQTLVLFALLLFATMALAALVIDGGSILLARRQLQSAVNSAAVEGLRFRDGVPVGWQSASTAPPGLIAAVGDPPASGYDPSNPSWQSWINQARRWAAANAANQVMTSPDASYFAAQTLRSTGGRSLNVGGTSFQVGQTIQWQQTPEQYAPDLQPNVGDTDDGGDMVAGQYNPADVLHSEDDNYLRTDFASSVTAGANSAFLVRMRRTNEGFDGSRSSWFPVPSLFNGVSALNANYPTGGYPVRATAVADARPAISVDGFGTFNMVNGVVVPTAWINWAFQGPQFWNLVAPGPVTVEQDGSGLLLRTPSLVTLSNAVDGSSATTTISVTPPGLPDPDGDPEKAYEIAVSTTTGMAPIEAMLVRDVNSNGTTLTVDRGILNSALTVHNAGDSVYIVAGFSTRANTLAGNLNSSSLTINVSFPAGSQPTEVDGNGTYITTGTGVYTIPYAAQIQNEIVLVTASNGPIWTVERGFAGTTPSMHPALVPVNAVAPISVGDMIFAAGLTPVSPASSVAPIYNDFGFGQPRVIGFGNATLGPPTVRLGQRNLVTINMVMGSIASADAAPSWIPKQIVNNATGATSTIRLAPDLTFSAANLSALMPLLLNAHFSLQGPILAPALVRSIALPPPPNLNSP